MKRLEIVVAGAGVGGLAASLGLARLGHRVVLAEKFAEPRPLGSGLILQPTGLGVLEALGLGDDIRAHGAPIRRLFGRSRGRVVLDVSYAALGKEAVAIHRAALFHVLFEAALREPRISIERGFAAEGVARGADGKPSLVSENGRRIGPFDMAVDAAGARSPLSAAFAARRRTLRYGALWANVPWPGAPFEGDALEQVYDGAHRMAGVLPIGRRPGETEPLAAFFWSLKPQDYDAWKERGLDAWREEVEALWPEALPAAAAISDPHELILATYGHHTLTHPFDERLAVIGDAAHATSPQLGQGANMALLDAAALVAAVEATGDPTRAPRTYADARSNHVRLYQTISALFTPFYQSDSAVLPWLRDRLFAPVSRAPGVGWMLAKMVAGEIGR